jgi:hypothetical protein
MRTPPTRPRQQQVPRPGAATAPGKPRRRGPRRHALALTLALGAFTPTAAALAAPPTKRAPAARYEAETWQKRAAFAFEWGLGSTFTKYNVGGISNGALLFTSFRGTYDLDGPWSVQIAFRQWWLSGDNQVIVPGAGARYLFHSDEAGRGYADATLGPGFTSYGTGLAFDLAAGFEFNLPPVPGVGLGPVLRYGQVINPDDRTDNDGHAWLIGVSISYHLGRAAAAAGTAEKPEREGPVRPYQFRVVDTDGDGVTDDADQCKEVPAGRFRDLYRLGCPDEDTDDDNVADGLDACPLNPAGAQPDPKWPGCPFTDSDGDGIGDLDDRCPHQAGAPSPDASKVGCPETGKKGRGAKKPAENKAPPTSGPAPTRKRSVK